MAPLLKELQRREGLCSLVCVTAQHRGLLDQVMEAFALRADYDLDIMRAGQSLCDITTAALRGLDGVIQEAAPDLLLVHGDTTSCLAGALAAYYHRVPLGHVEAGLRSYDRYSPFPEEMNRQLTDRLAGLLFAPTEHSRRNLLREGLPPERIFVTGNTVIDALRQTVRADFQHPALENLGERRRLVLLTAHRRENQGEAMAHIFRAARQLAERFPEVTILAPLHPNPAVRDCARPLLDGVPGIRVIEPPDVLSFHNLLARCELALSDSGGVQEEAAALGVPVLVLRDTTERPEGLESGALKLVGTDEARIVREASRLLTDEAARERMRGAPNPFGDGHAAARIADIIEAQRCCRD